MCVNEVWGSVCDSGWDKTDAHIICQQLGHPELGIYVKHILITKLNCHFLTLKEPVAFRGSYFGTGIYPIVYSNVQCGGWEESLSDCPKDTYQEVACTNNQLAGVLCGYGTRIFYMKLVPYSLLDCSNGDVRLVGGSGDYEGTVEVCFNNLWGLVSESGWTTTDAQVVCAQLGYGLSGNS